MNRIPAARVVLILFLGLASFVDLYHDRILTWMDPEMMDIYHQHQKDFDGALVLDWRFPFTGNLFDEDFGQPKDRSAATTGNVLSALQLAAYLDQPTIKGCFIRYLLVDIAPQSYGSLTQWATWRAWWKSTCFSGGIAKAMFIVALYGCLISTAYRWVRNDWEPVEDDVHPSATLTTFSGIVFCWGLIAVPFILPGLDWLNETVRYVFPGIIVLLWLIIWFFVRVIVFLVQFIGITLIGTLILAITSPLLILHGYVQMALGG